MVDADARNKQFEECIALAKQIVENKDKMKMYEEKDWYQVRLEWQEGKPVVVSTLTVDGVMVDDYRNFTANYLENVKRLAPSNASFSDKGMDGERQIVHQVIKPGVPLVATRHLMNTYYRKDESDEHIFVVSSLGNEHLYEKYKADIPDGDVIATMFVNYMHFKPLLDSCDDVCGTEVTQVIKTDPNGDIINALKEKLVGYQAKSIIQFTEDIKKNKK